jgi:uncharacterized protein (DUF488 family)
MIKTIYTIGYSGYKIDSFLRELRKYKISSVIDVRSEPYSRYYFDYNREKLKAILEKNGFFYRNYKREFGARQNDRAFYSSDGYLDFEKFTGSEEFLNGVKKLKVGMSKNYSFVLMCAEKDPFDCHRTMMIAREFHKQGYKIIHLISNEKEQTQEDIEIRLLNYYFPNRNQLALFKNDHLSDQNLITKAYGRRNAEIGYSLREDE